MIRLALLLSAAGCLLLTLASGCAIVHPAVPVVGGAEATVALIGVWEGSYHSPSTGRSGAIHFELAAEPDSMTGARAAGEVVMTYFDSSVSFYPPYYHDHAPGSQGPHLETAVLTIRFVHVGDGRVSGTLDPYPNPECGCTLRTMFEGMVKEGTIEGIFVARSPEHGHVQRGTWRVVRGS